jgi:hypothetical protein
MSVVYSTVQYCGVLLIKYISSLLDCGYVCTVVYNIVSYLDYEIYPTVGMRVTEYSVTHFLQTYFLEHTVHMYSTVYNCTSLLYYNTFLKKSN